jgi:hypothetical protein
MSMNRTTDNVARLWDGQPVDLDDLDPSLVETLHRFTGAGDHVPELDSRFVKHLWEDLMDTSVMQGSGNQNASPAPGARQRIIGVTEWTPRIAFGHPRWLAALVSAALLLLTLGLAFSQIEWRPEGAQAPGGMVIQAPVSPSPDGEVISTETLFAITLLPDVMPVGELGTTLLGWETIPANMVTTREASACCRGFLVHLIIDGSVTIEGDGPIQVYRHDQAGVREDHGAGESAALEPGDLVVVRFEDGQTWTTGAADVEVVMGELASGDFPGQFAPHEWVDFDYIYDLNSVPLHGGPYTFTLTEVTVESPSREMVELPTDGFNQLAIIKDGKAIVGTGTDGVIRVGEMTEPVSIFVLTLSSTDEGTGTPVAGISTRGNRNV